MLYLFLLYKAFFGHLLTYASFGKFPFLSIINISKLEHLHQAASCAIFRCLLPSPIPLFIEASLPLLQVTLTHFALSSHERALRFPISFPISDFARLGVKARLCRSSWRAIASTHPLMLPSTSPRKALLAWSPSLPWNPLSFTVESTLSSPCSRSDLPLAHLDSHF